MFLSRCRKTVDTFLPPLGWSYRLMRDATRWHRAVQTSYGFTLAGGPIMAAEGWECRWNRGVSRVGRSPRCGVSISEPTSASTPAWLPAAESTRWPSSRPNVTCIISTGTCGPTGSAMWKSFPSAWRDGPDSGACTAMATWLPSCLDGRRPARRSFGAGSTHLSRYGRGRPLPGRETPHQAGRGRIRTRSPCRRDKDARLGPKTNLAGGDSAPQRGDSRRRQSGFCKDFRCVLETWVPVPQAGQGKDTRGTGRRKPLGARRCGGRGDTRFPFFRQLTRESGNGRRRGN